MPASTGQNGPERKQVFPAEMTLCKLRIPRPGVAGGEFLPASQRAYFPAF